MSNLILFSVSQTAGSITICESGCIIALYAIDKVVANYFSSYRESTIKKHISVVQNLTIDLAKFTGIVCVGANIYQYKFLQGNHYLRNKDLLDPELYSTISMTFLAGTGVLKAIDNIASRFFFTYQTSKTRSFFNRIKIIANKITNTFGLICLGLHVLDSSNMLLHLNDSGFFRKRVEKYVGADAFSFDPKSSKDAALVFKAINDSKNAFTSKLTMESIRQLSEHRDIQIVEISSPNEICPLFEKASRIKSIKDVAILAHGESDRILFDPDHDLTNDTFEQQLSCLKNIPEAGAFILF